jgi:hypothetical protein
MEGTEAAGSRNRFHGGLSTLHGLFPYLRINPSNGPGRPGHTVTSVIRAILERRISAAYD